VPFVVWSRNKMCPLPALITFSNYFKHLTGQGFTAVAR